MARSRHSPAASATRSPRSGATSAPTAATPRSPSPTTGRKTRPRRDFTINAMSAAPVGTLYDYFGGQQDLTAGRVRFVGDPGDAHRRRPPAPAPLLSASTRGTARASQTTMRLQPARMPHTRSRPSRGEARAGRNAEAAALRLIPFPPSRRCGKSVCSRSCCRRCREANASPVWSQSENDHAEADPVRRLSSLMVDTDYGGVRLRCIECAGQPLAPFRRRWRPPRRTHLTCLPR